MDVILKQRFINIWMKSRHGIEKMKHVVPFCLRRKVWATWWHPQSQSFWMG
jgi:hypothetical protein